MADELHPEVLGVATLAALLALGPATTPVPRLDNATIFVREAANRGWWYYDPDATTGGQTPTSDGVGRWFGPVPYQISAAGVLGNLGGSGGVVGAVAIDDLAAAIKTLNAYTESAETTISNSSLIQIAHGLGVTPKDWHVVLRCKTAELGFAVGDELSAEALYLFSNPSDFGMQFHANSVNINIVCSPSPFRALRPNTFTVSAMTNANWRIVARWR